MTNATGATPLKMYINGQWTESESRKRFEAINPATGEVIATLPEGTREDAKRAVLAASENRNVMEKMSIWERSRLCVRIADTMEKRREELATILTKDQGKPYHTEALGEVDFAIHGFRNAAEQIKWLETSFIPTEGATKRVYSYYKPRGIFAIVTPWNFPMGIPVEYLAPGLATGNTMVWIPAPSTSVCAVKMMECFEDAGVPAGGINLVTGPGAVVGDEAVGHPLVNGIGFTGSTLTGNRIAKRGAGKALLLEQGGNGPAVILDDADLKHAAETIAFGCFFNAGQVCGATGRILVQRSAHDELLDHLLQAANKVILGDPFDQNTTMGPLNNSNVREKIDEHLAGGKKQGARVLIGGGCSSDWPQGNFYQATVVDQVPADSLLNMAETFGPVAPLVCFDKDEEGLAIARNNPYGLISSVFSKSIKRAFYFAENMRSGIINVNDGNTYWEGHIPFGGAAGTDSGLGRLGGKHTLMAMSDLRTINFDINH